jgi:S1-C subfamily serine protease
MAKIGQPYQSTSFKSQLLSQTDSRHVWGLDPDEIEWALQNQDAIMDQAFQVSPTAAGGIRIDSIQAGSIGAARGLVGGDIIKDVNGQPLNSVADVKTLLTSPAMRAQTGLRINVERAGKPLIVEYRPLPR